MNSEFIGSVKPDYLCPYCNKLSHWDIQLSSCCDSCFNNLMRDAITSIETGKDNDKNS